MMTKGEKNNRTNVEKTEKLLRDVDFINRASLGMMDNGIFLIISYVFLPTSFALMLSFPSVLTVILAVSIVFLLVSRIALDIKKDSLRRSSSELIMDLSTMTTRASDDIHEHRIGKINGYTLDSIKLSIQSTERGIMGTSITTMNMSNFGPFTRYNVESIMLHSRFALAIHQFAEANIPFNFNNLDLESVRAEEGIFVASSFCDTLRQAGNEDNENIEKKQAIIYLMENHIEDAAPMISPLHKYQRPGEEYRIDRDDVAQTITALAEYIKAEDEKHGQGIPFFALTSFAISDDETGRLEVFEYDTKTHEEEESQ